MNEWKLLKSAKEFEQYMGWANLENMYSQVDRINKVASKVRRNSEILVVIGVGGSFLGAKAVIEALSPKFNREIEVVYLGNSLSEADLKETLEYLKTKDFTVNLISKSGTTFETALAFRYVRELLEEKYGESMKDRLVVTAGESQLLDYAKDLGCETFEVPEDVGGRFSVLTPVGLFPIAVAGIDVESLLDGAQKTFDDLEEDYTVPLEYADFRFNSYLKGKDIEVLAYYEPRLEYLAKWWQQLFAESEGKNGRGVFPTSACFTTDLHSIGQLIQDGKRNIFETHIWFKSKGTLEIKENKEDFDNLNQYSGITVNKANELSMKGSMEAHYNGNVPIFQIEVSELNEESLGRYISFMLVACSVSSIKLGVNPFNQPGVEGYKNNLKTLMFKERLK